MRQYSKNPTNLLRLICISSTIFFSSFLFAFAVGNVFMSPRPSAALSPVSDTFVTDDNNTISYTISQPDIAINCIDTIGSPCSDPELFAEQQTVEVTTDNSTGYQVRINLASDETCMRKAADLLTDTPCASIAADSKISSIPNVQDGITTNNLINNLGTNLWGISLNIHEANDETEALASTWFDIPTNSSGTSIEITEGDPAAEEAANGNITTVTYGVKANPDDGSITGGVYQTEVVYTIVPNYNASNESWSFEVDPSPTSDTFIIPTARSNINFYALTKNYYEIWHTLFDCLISPSPDSLPCSKHDYDLNDLADLEDILMDIYTGGFAYNWNIDWGDGTSEQVSGISSFDSAGIPHEYPNSGDPNYDPNGYTITISPAGTALPGWLNAFGSSAGALIGGQDNHIIGLPEPFPYGAFPVRQGALQGLFAGMTLDCEIPDGLFSNFYQTLNDATTVSADIFDGMFFGTFANVYSGSNLDPSLIKIPEGIFDGLDTSRGTSFNSTFMETFAYGGGVLLSVINSVFGSGTNTYVAPELFIPEDLFAGLDFSNANTLNSTFAGTFSGLATQASDYLLPAGLFDFLNTANSVTSLAGTFLGTFSIAPGSTTITIPPSFYANLNTANVTDFSLTFVFLTIHNYEQSVIIPDDLFAYMDTSQGKKFPGTFAAMFTNLANIPEGLFDNIDTSSGEDFTGMFCGFTGFCLLSLPSPDIPPGLFDSFNTSNGTEFYGMFYTAFPDPASIPPGLFSFLDTSQATSETTIQLFRSVLGDCCSSPIPSVSINDLFTGANLSGLITDPTTLDQTDNSALYHAFLFAFSTSYPYLTGNATQFINEHLGGLNPNGYSNTFNGQTALTDWATLPSIWGGGGI